jgi:poly(hydroxyalkanoate) granule-associated protein
MRSKERNCKMNDEPNEYKVTDKEANPFLEATRKVLLASIGVMAIAQDEIEDFVSKLIERGEIAEKDGRRLVGEVMERRQKTSKSAEEEVTKRFQQFLERLNIPTKDDIDALNMKINLLSKKIEDLKKIKSDQGGGS